MLQPFRHLVFARPREGERRLPLQVRSVGHYRLNRPGPVDPPRHRSFFQLFWCVEGEGWFLNDGGERVGLPAGWVRWCRPGALHHLEAGAGPWEYGFVTFAATETAALEVWDWPGETWLGGSPPMSRFRELLALVADGSESARRRASVHVWEILLRACLGPEPAPLGPASRIREAITRRYHRPDFTVEALAGELGLHRSTLYRTFKRSYGQSPSAFLHRLRLQRARTLLRETVLPVQEVAWSSGFADPNYFARSFRRAAGRSPAEWRVYSA